MMIAILISILGIMALLSSMDVATQYNVKNQLRDEAVKIAEAKMKELMSGTFASVSVPLFPPETVKSTWGHHSYTVLKSTNILSDNSRELIVNVGWAFKNISSHQEVRSIKSQ